MLIYTPQDRIISFDPSIRVTAKALKSYLLYDRFDTERSAGAVNGTQAEPTGGTRTVADTTNQISVSGGTLNFAGGLASPAWSNPSLSYGAVTRVAGKTLMFQASSPTRVRGGFFTTPNSNSGSVGDQVWWKISGNVGTDALNTTLGSVTDGTTYNYALVMRSTGAYWFIKGGTQYPNWTFMWSTPTGSEATLYPTFENYNATPTYDNIKIPTNLWLPTPLAYDTFTRADGTIGSSETVGPDGSSAPAQPVPSLAWTSQVGTVAIATNKAKFSALSTVGIATIPSGKSDVLISVIPAIGAGNGGIVARYQDANNYLFAYHDGTNAKLYKMVTGTPTSLISAAGAYNSAYVLRLILDGVNARLYYNNALIGTATVPSSAYTAHGLYTTDLSNTFDNFTIFAGGTGNEYSPLDAM